MQARMDELVKATLSRKRGKQAYDALVSQDDGFQIVVDMTGTDACSLSFLDELVWRMHESDLLQRTVFVTSNPQHVMKLGRVSDIRHLTILRLVGAKIEIVEPVAGPTLVEVPSPSPPPDDID